MLISVQKKPWKRGARLNNIQNQTFLADFGTSGHEWSDIIQMNIMMSASGPCAQIMPDKITSDKAFKPFLKLPRRHHCHIV